MSKILIVGNWKMNLDVHQASMYVHQLSEKISPHDDVEVVLAPTTLALQTLSLQVKRGQFGLCAQNVYFQDSGAFTGEVSASQLRGLVQYVIVGHSERRHIFNENDKDVRAKVQAVLRNGLTPILCVGETADERANNETKHVLHDQITGGLANVSSEEISKVVIAYEPVWAISTGQDYKNHKTPTPKDLEVVSDIIRHQISSLYGHAAEQKMRLLYGASVNVDNCVSFLHVKGVNGLLPGGASLNLEQFVGIVQKAHTLKNTRSSTT